MLFWCLFWPGLPPGCLQPDADGAWKISAGGIPGYNRRIQLFAVKVHHAGHADLIRIIGSVSGVSQKTHPTTMTINVITGRFGFYSLRVSKSRHWQQTQVLPRHRRGARENGGMPSSTMTWMELWSVHRFEGRQRWPPWCFFPWGHDASEVSRCSQGSGCEVREVFSRGGHQQVSKHEKICIFVWVIYFCINEQQQQ